MDSNKKTLLVSIIGVIVFIVFIVGASYAYYVANISEQRNSGEDGSTNLGAAKLDLTFDGENVLTWEKIIPGDIITKTFHVANHGSDACYSIYWKNVQNDFVNKDDLKVTLSVLEDETSTTLSPVTSIFPSTSSDIQLLYEGQKILKDKTQDFSLTVEYINTESKQNDDIGKSLSSSIVIELGVCQ